MRLPTVKTNGFKGMTKEEALKVVRERGGETLNKGNPWVTSEKVYDRLRAKLGFWKALGANKSVISWLGYGIPMRFQTEPSYKAFKHHRMTEEAKAFVQEDVDKHVASGCFVKAPRKSVKVENPILTIKQGDKWRRCDDCRYTNAYQTNAHFRMASLGNDIPLLTEEGDIGITRDLEKAY